MFQITVSFIWSRWPSSNPPKASSKRQARSTLRPRPRLRSPALRPPPRSPNTRRRAVARRAPPSRGRPPVSPPRSRLQPIRTPLKSRLRGLRKRLPDSAMSERESRPALTLSMSAASSTVRAMGPSTESVNHAARSGQVGTRPGEGRTPTTLQKEAGLRKMPPMLLPSAIGSSRRPGLLSPRRCSHSTSWWGRKG